MKSETIKTSNSGLLIYQNEDGKVKLDVNLEDETINFFKIVQNKFHYAVHGNTVAEVIYSRV